MEECSLHTITNCWHTTIPVPLVLTEPGEQIPRDAVDLRIINETRKGIASGKGTVEKYTSSKSETICKNHYYGLLLGIIDSPSAVGGCPSYVIKNKITDNDHDGMDDAWEKTHGLNPKNRDDRNVCMKNGYTALEVYLNSLVGE